MQHDSNAASVPQLITNISLSCGIKHANVVKHYRRPEVCPLASCEPQHVRKLTVTPKLIAPWGMGVSRIRVGGLETLIYDASHTALLAFVAYQKSGAAQIDVGRLVAKL
jgi:hypothetical protein